MSRLLARCLWRPGSIVLVLSIGVFRLCVEADGVLMAIVPIAAMVSIVLKVSLVIKAAVKREVTVVFMLPVIHEMDHFDLSVLCV